MPHVPLRSRAAGGGALYIEGWAVTEGREGNAGCPGIHVSACWRVARWRQSRALRAAAASDCNLLT